MKTSARLFTFLLAAAVFTTGVFVASAKEAKCPVCHNDNHPHTVMINCKDVDKYLSKHPGDYAGQCQAVSGEKPPKPTPTPKPPKPTPTPKPPKNGPDGAEQQ